MRNVGKAVGVLAGSIALLGAVVGAAVAVLTVVFARRVVTPSGAREEDIRIIAVDRPAGRIVIEGHEADMPGRYGFWFEHDAGHARLGDVVEVRDRRVTRSIERVDFGRLERAARGRIEGSLFIGPWELGVPYADVIVPTALGAAPAWEIPADEASDRWVVQVHGRGAKRQEALRAVAPARAAGWNSLLMSYRNDGEAPESIDRRYGLGGTEWEDVVDAVRYARERGAREVVLMGWSMGGAISLQAVLRSTEVREVLSGMILESPAIDWADILRFQGSMIGLPDQMSELVTRLLAAPVAVEVTGLAAPIDLESLDAVARAHEFGVPMLLMASEDDGFVPITGARRFAEARPDLIEFEVFHGARHTKLWNAEPERWEGLIEAWLLRRSVVGTPSGEETEIAG
nr:alpha/beta fold hydrolase [Agromyces sp. LHK192]